MKWLSARLVTAFLAAVLTASTASAQVTNFSTDVKTAFSGARSELLGAGSLQFEGFRRGTYCCANLLHIYNLRVIEQDSIKADYFLHICS